MVHLRLTINRDGSVDICSCSPDGEVQWFLIRMNKNGTFTRYSSIHSDSGFQIDSQGRLIERGS